MKVNEVSVYQSRNDAFLFMGFFEVPCTISLIEMRSIRSMKANVTLVLVLRSSQILFVKLELSFVECF
jgi:hypothetical protein